MSRRSSLSVPGFRVAGVRSGLKPSGSLDLALLVSERRAAVAGMFTRHQVPGAPVVVTRRRVRGGYARAVVVNAGISNVARGREGLRDAIDMTREVAERAGVPEGEVLVASTGVIGVPLPMDRVRAGIEKASRQLRPDAWSQAARAILTTDTRPKQVRAKGSGFSLIGIAKGSGMIQPRMATMLAFVATDLAAEPAFLDEALREAVGPSLNSLTIDGETSTSDMVLVLANGAAGGPALEAGSQSARAREFRSALCDLCDQLAEKLALDGEGVTRIARIAVKGASNDRAADRVARSVANSMLFKTALFGGDPNWGRIVQAAGAAGVRFSPSALDVRVGGVELLTGGEPTGRVAAASRAMGRKRVSIEIGVGGGPGQASILTTDLSYDYVRINAEYTT